MGADLSVFTPAVLAAVFKRDGGRCASCGRKWLQEFGRGEPWGWDMQHRMARGMGGARKNPAIGDVSNAVILCRGCHHKVEVTERELGFKRGFAIKKNGTRQPWEAEIMHRAHGWCLLTREGGFTPCAAPPD